VLRRLPCAAEIIEENRGFEIFTSRDQLERSETQEQGKDVCLMEGADLAKALLAAGLVDNPLNIDPIPLGSGIPASRDFGQRIKLTLAACRTPDGGWNLGDEQLDSCPDRKGSSQTGRSPTFDDR
jgi:hypothetical protein